MKHGKCILKQGQHDAFLLYLNEVLCSIIKCITFTLFQHRSQQHTYLTKLDSFPYFPLSNSFLKAYWQVATKDDLWVYCYQSLSSRLKYILCEVTTLLSARLVKNMISFHQYCEFFSPVRII